MKKYKLKTHKATAKRFKLTGTGKVIRKQQQLRNSPHARGRNRAQRKQNPDSYVISAPGEVRRIKKLLNI